VMAGDNKDPSYPWYPRDYGADELVMQLTLEEEGALRRLLDHQWLHGSIPSDFGQLGRICKSISGKKMQKMWSALGAFFPLESAPGRLQNRRLERVRGERKDYRDKKVESGKLGAEARWGHRSENGTAIHSPIANDGSALALASASASASALALSPPPTHAGANAREGRESSAEGTQASVDQLRGALPKRFRPDFDTVLSQLREPLSWCRELAVMVEEGIEGVPISYGDLGHALHDLCLNGKAEDPNIGLVRAYAKRIVTDRQTPTRQGGHDRTRRKAGPPTLIPVAPTGVMRPPGGATAESQAADADADLDEHEARLAARGVLVPARGPVESR
jgi:uncharacterized protein YdaU (DUF1376 family)